MNRPRKILITALLALITFEAAGTETDSVRHQIEAFLSTGFGTVVSVILTLLLLLWLLLPLAVFGLKRKLKTLINESRETNRLLTEIRNELAMIDADATDVERAGPAGRNGSKDAPDALYDEIRFDP